MLLAEKPQFTAPGLTTKEIEVETQTVPREDIVEMLRWNAEATGLGLRDFYELGKDDRLDHPLLRDLWLIWGDVLTESDLLSAA
ncbi:hypothetical protein [Candidatus Poriferisocius sp.]|uniref:hypothetical protein n=1 Tax=Candidatus Poriferisocius sp. TaxID=3101276 RepID=UPI003B59E7C2